MSEAREWEVNVAGYEQVYGEPRVTGALPEKFTISRSRDFRAIRALALHPRIFPHICDDFSNDPNVWQPTENEQVIYLLAKDEKGAFGFGVFIPQTHSQYGAHLGFLPRSWGGQALGSWKAMFAWMWKYTKALRIVGEIARDNRLAIRLCMRAGCKIYGINPRSKLRGGKLVDQVCVGISKPE